MSNWQPIETAPKNGTEVLTWGVRRGMDIAVYDPGSENEEYAWTCTSSGMSLDHESRPTHWMPLPEPPRE